jgi:hypothetical protein
LPPSLPLVSPESLKVCSLLSLRQAKEMLF